jgi:hypothetical protein
MGAFVEARTDDGMSPLMVALNYHYPSMITMLLALGADPNGKGGTFVPLHKAVCEILYLIFHLASVLRVFTLITIHLSTYLTNCEIRRLQ